MTVRPARRDAGVAIPETALVMLTVMLLLFGGLRLALVGYTQLAVDGAAFTDARLTGVGDPQAVAKTTTAVGRVQSGDISTATGLPPSAAAPPDYNVGDDQDRHGGVTMIQPAQIVATVLKSDLDGLLIGQGGTLTVTGRAIAPSFLDFYAHDDVLGQNLNSAAALGSAVDYFTNGENVPPYLIGFHYMAFCETSFESGPWNTCPATQDWAALGVAEFLDDDNWGRTQAGVAGGDSTFKEMLCHQQYFANVAALVAAAPDAASAASTLTDTQSDIATIYSWDSHTPGGYPPADYTGPGSYPLHPDNGC